MISREATIEKLETDVRYWEERYAQSEKQNNNLIDRAERSEARSVSTALAKAQSELLEGNEERAANAILGWFESEGKDVAKAAAMATEWVLSFFGESEAEAAEEALKYAQIATAMDPITDEYRKTQINLSALRDTLDQDAGASTGVTRPWEVTSHYADPMSEEQAYALNERAAKALDDDEVFLALALYRRCWTCLRRETGRDRTDSFVAQINMANCMDKLGRHSEAFHHVTFAYESLRKICGPAGEKTLQAEVALGDLLLSLGQPEKALQHLEHAYSGLVVQSGPGDHNIVECREKIARTLLALGRPSEAEPICREVIEGYTKILGEGHSTTSFSKATLAHVLGELGRRDEAAELLIEQALLMRRTNQPYDHRLSFELFVASVLGEWGIPPPADALPLALEIEQQWLKLGSRRQPLQIGNLLIPWKQFDTSGAKPFATLGR